MLKYLIRDIRLSVRCITGLHLGKYIYFTPHGDIFYHGYNPRGSDLYCIPVSTRAVAKLALMGIH